MDTDIIKIVSKENEGINELLYKMFETKKQENKNVECEYNGQVLSTEGINNIQELFIKYNNIIFDMYEKDRNKLLESAEMQNTINNFKDRGVDEAPLDQINEIEKLEQEFDQKVKELETLDYTKSINVLEWLNSIVKYVNNIELYIPIDKKDYMYGSTTNYIIKKLEEHGYTTETNQVNNVDDYYKRLIAYQLQDLDKYQFFAYEYADAIRDKIDIKEENKSVEEDKKEDEIVLEDLINKQQELIEKINSYTMLIEGTKRRTKDKKFIESESFKNIKANLKNQIDKLEQNAKNSTDEEKIIEEAREAVNKVKTIAYNNSTQTVDEQNVLKSFYNTEIFPKNDEFIKTLELVQKLPENSTLRQPIIDAIVKLSTRYNLNKEKEEKDEIKIAFEKFGINIENNNNEELDKLKEEYKLIEQEEEFVKVKFASKKLKAEKELEEINNKIEIEKQKAEQQNVNPSNEVNKQVSETNNNENKDYETRLHELAEEGPIFVDMERRLDSKDQWMEQNTAIKFGKLDMTNEQSVTNDQPTTNESDIFELEPKEDSMMIPHPIKSIKKASIRLIEKVRSNEFVTKIKNALNYIKEKLENNKQLAATAATVLIVGGIAMLGAELKNTNEEVLNSVNNVDRMEQNIEDATVNENNNIETEVEKENLIDPTPIEKSNSELTEQAIQDAINGIMDGDEVYTNKYNAINDENGRPTSMSQKEESWANAEVGMFYDTNAEILNREQAEEIIANGGEVVARFDNNGTPIGYAKVGSLLENDTTGLSK